MQENYVYPANIRKINNRIRIEFIDFPNIIVEENTESEAIRAAQECLALEILDYESKNKKIPQSSDVDAGAIYIHIWMPYFRNYSKEVYVKKNVTIPQWLDLLAKENKINYSAALVKGIKMELGIDIR